MMLADVIDAYLTRQRSLGMRFDSAGQLLHRFGRAMGDRPIEEVTPGAILDFLNGNGALTATWTLKHRVLTGLYRFAVSRGYVDNSPLPTTLPKLPIWWQNAIWLGTPRSATAIPWRSCCRLPASTEGVPSIA